MHLVSVVNSLFWLVLCHCSTEMEEISSYLYLGGGGLVIVFLKVTCSCYILTI
jgi:hypothetical protein